MELAHYVVTYRDGPNGCYVTYPVYCHGEYEAIEQIKKTCPDAVIISVNKR